MATSEKITFKDDETLTFHAPWEKGLTKLITPFERFIDHQAAGGLILMATALVALIIANSPLLDSYQALLQTRVGFGFGDWTLEKSLHHWINDGLMALFFFLVGLELKREILVGELSDLKMAALPIAAAIGGMLVPALIYYSMNPTGLAANGWGIPMATDIAFALGVIALLAGRIPKSLITFLVAVAIVDDLGAVLVIALFYTEQLVIPFILAGVALTAMMILFNLLGVRRPGPYFILGGLLWFCLLKSGVHATLAGVITAFTIPTLPRYNPKSFSDRMKELLGRFDASHEEKESILRNQEMATIVHALEEGVKGVKTPLQRLEHGMHTPVAFFVLPVFALFNAGVAIDFGNITASLLEPITLGVALGLMAGKLIGVVGFSMLSIKLGLASLPSGANIKHIVGAAMLASIGFTMSIFIAELAFAGQPELIQQAKMGILFASFIAGIAGYLWLRLLGKTS